MLFPTALLTRQYRGQNGNAGLSPRIWDFYTEAAMGAGEGTSPASMFEHFTNFQGVAPAISGATSGLSDGFATFQNTTTTASTATQIAHEDGVIEMLAGATAHHEVTIQAGGLSGAFFRIAANRGSSVRAFEARVRIPTGSASAAQGAFIGVAAPGNTTTNFMANTTLALRDVNIIGFHLPIGAGNAIRPVCRRAGVAVVDTIGSVHTYVPGTWVKLGFIYNRRASQSEALTFYVNNEPVAVVSQAVIDASYPVDAFMSPIMSVKTLNVTGARLQCDWIGAFKQ